MAVSGGVDSVALLSLLVGVSKVDLVVAHFDHGIRADSSADAQLIASLARQYGLPFELGHGKLPANASEQVAREARYRFLRDCQKKHEAQALITAHHQDDVVETAVLNIIRGTSWRGLASLRSTDDCLRPLLEYSKEEISTYAREQQLSWNQDSTNQNQDYLRNYIRLTLLPNAKTQGTRFTQKFLTSIRSVQTLRPEIEGELDTLLADANQAGGIYVLPRYQCIMWPSEVTREVLYEVLARLETRWHPSTMQLRRLERFIKTGRSKTYFPLHKDLKIRLEQTRVVFQKV